jgi:hypothetical protein
VTDTARARRPSRQPPERDTESTPFAVILEGLVARVPGAYAAALVDLEGETVDYVGRAGSFELRVAAAEVRLALDQVAHAMPGGHARWMIVRGARKTISARALPEGYAVVLLLRRRAGFTASRRAFATCERELAVEAGWTLPGVTARPALADVVPAPGAGRPRLAEPSLAALDGPWWPVAVDVDRRGRPRRVRIARERAVELEVLGAVVGLARSEQGFRVRTLAGEEVTLVREARRCWYADAPMR